MVFLNSLVSHPGRGIGGAEEIFLVASCMLLEPETLTEDCYIFFVVIQNGGDDVI